MRFQAAEHHDVDMGTNIVNLIDVLLLLLIFFMITTTFSKSAQLGVDLPEASAQAAQKNDKQIEIVITADGHYSVNDRNVTRGDIDTIKAALSEAAAGDNTVPLTIMATPIRRIRRWYARWMRRGNWALRI